MKMEKCETVGAMRAALDGLPDELPLIGQTHSGLGLVTVGRVTQPKYDMAVVRVDDAAFTVPRGRGFCAGVVALGIAALALTGCGRTIPVTFPPGHYTPAERADRVEKLNRGAWRHGARFVEVPQDD